MSKFEYVSVAIALLYSLGIARLLGGLPHVSTRDRGSWIVLVWTVGLILTTFVGWWVMWRFSGVEWTPLRFAWVLGNPLILYVQAAVLITDNPSQISSWEDHYFAARHKFFGIFLVSAFHLVLLPWVVGLFLWWTPAPAHATVPLILGVSLVGGLSKSRRLHLGIALVMLASVVLSFFLVPSL